MHWSQAFSAYDAVQTGGKTLVSGTATVNGVHFYIKKQVPTLNNQKLAM